MESSRVGKADWLARALDVLEKVGIDGVRTERLARRGLSKNFELIRKNGAEFCVQNCTKQGRELNLSIEEASFPAAVVW